MSWLLETLNHGEVPNFGFLINTDQIMLGQLPEISTKQFCRYATETVESVFPKADLSQQGLMIGYIDSNFDKIRDLKVREIPALPIAIPASFFKLLEQARRSGDQVQLGLLEELLRNTSRRSNTPDVIDYQHTPFEVARSRVWIGGRYLVTAPEFTSFSTNYMAGGHFGWDKDLGIPEYAHSSLIRLHNMIG